MPSPISDYAMIGDCKTAALVGRDGSIDWLCLPRFDSDACFASLLGNPENGRWQLTPVSKAEVSRRYRPETLVLETEFRTRHGTVTLIDFMPMSSANPQIIRLVRGDHGSVRMQMDLVIRFDYGRTVPWVTRQPDQSLVAIAGPHRLVLRSSVGMRGEGLRTISNFTVEKGKTIRFELQYGDTFRRTPDRIDAQSALRKTEKWWRKWISRCKYHGPYSNVVKRSLITVKALTYAPTGAIVAAPTTSLPEEVGGNRNWDYRFCWLRDATFTLLAFLHSGYHDEARRWKDWLIRAIAGSAEQMQVLYGVAGERNLLEWEVPWLSGYKGALPVRVGNAASEQVQLDIYGELSDVLHQAAMHSRNKPDVDLQQNLVGHLQKVWHEPDQGIWELRGPKRNFTYSKAMTWVAFDRIIRTCEQFGIPGPLKKWKGIRQRIHDDVCRFGFNRQVGSFVASYRASALDASLLLLTLVGFLPPSDARIQSTVHQIEKSLVHDGLVLRYKPTEFSDNLTPNEGAFLPCTCWLADNYSLMGRYAEAQRVLERILKLQNDVGLLSEEYHLQTKQLVGNFPQAFSHVALVNTIINLHTKRGPARQRSGSHSERPNRHR